MSSNESGPTGELALQTLAMPKDTNANGDIFGGWLVSQMDLAAGIASKMFSVLADAGINIQIITTSEIKISVVIEEKYMELAVRSLHSAFELEGPSPIEE